MQETNACKWGLTSTGQIELDRNTDPHRWRCHQCGFWWQWTTEACSLCQARRGESLPQLATIGEPLAKTLNLLLSGIEAQYPEMLCSVLLLDADGVHVRHAAAPRLPVSFTEAIDGASIGPRAGSCGTAAYRREPVIVDDIASHPLWIDYRDLALVHDLRACWSTPILNRKWRVLGTFALYFRTATRPTRLHSDIIRTATYTASALLSVN